MKNAFLPGGALVPRGVDLQKWSVVACDQYTSEPEYWQRVAQYVGDAPSALKLTIPEIYLNDSGLRERIERINELMTQYLTDGILQPVGDGYILAIRTQDDGMVRYGLVGRLDLEAYDFGASSSSPVRATEGTVVERIPPRLRVRIDAPLEIPHAMLLIDDADGTVIERSASKTADYMLLYDTPLMERGGHLRGYLLPPDETKRVEDELERFFERPLALAVGDGNHSLATAKTHWDTLKQSLTESERETHPARFALCELVNLHSPALAFEPIHRVLYDIDTDALIKHSAEYCNADGADVFNLVTAHGTVELKAPDDVYIVGFVQNMIDNFLCASGGSVDYVHGDEVALRLGQQDGCAAILLPQPDKSTLFSTVERDGALPRKSFSMGHAWDKRYYFEARVIQT